MNFSRLIRLNFKLKVEQKGGESICKPGSVEDSHSSTTYITARL